MGVTQKFDAIVEIDGQDALHLVGFQPFLTLLDTENNGSVRAGIQNVNGAIGFFSGSSFSMEIHNSGTVEIRAQDALHLAGFEPFLTLVDNANNSFASAGIQNIGGDLFFFSDESRKNGTSQLRVHNAGHVTISGNLFAKDISLVR